MLKMLEMLETEMNMPPRTFLSQSFSFFLIISPFKNFEIYI